MRTRRPRCVLRIFARGIHADQEARQRAIIQVAMDWEDDHLHEFIVAHQRYSSPSSGGIDDLFDDDEVASESKIRLGASAPAVRNSFRYHYDFGDSWMHKLTVEKHLVPEPGQTYPCAPAVHAPVHPRTAAASGATRDFWRR
jgi:hypothetical protein